MNALVGFAPGYQPVVLVIDGERRRRDFDAFNKEGVLAPDSLELLLVGHVNLLWQ